MQFENTDIKTAQKLDAQDELASFRDEFVIDDPDCIYLNGNSLGRLPKRTVDIMQSTIEREWGERLVRGWNDSWMNAPREVGAKIATLIGAQPDEVIVTEATSTNLFKCACAALQARDGRNKIVSDDLNFPSDLYILQGIVDLFGEEYLLELVLSDDNVTISPDSLTSVIDGDTALVSLTQVAFKSAFMYDMKRVTEKAHSAGALMLWDLSHSVGAVPIDLNGCNVDMAVGCTYKYLNGGPGAPAFIYVRRDLQEQLEQPIQGWLGAGAPFTFDTIYTPAQDITRFQVGTPPVLSLKAVEPAIDIMLKAGIERIRAKSIAQTEYLIYLTKEWLAPLGFSIGTPLQPELRGSHVSLQHPEAYRITRALIDSPKPAVQVIPDFRAPDNIRLGIAPLYVSSTDIYRALERMRVIVEDKVYEKYSKERLAVT